MKSIKTNELLKLLKVKGYEINRQNGSHMTLKNASGQTVTIVNKREQAPGTLRNVAKLAGLEL